MTLHSINKLRSRGGFTLVELLIVMLIVGILSIAMLPMYKKYMTKAKYTAEGLPILATIKTQVDLFIYDKSYAPGLADTVYGWAKNGGASGDGQYTPISYGLATGSTYPAIDPSSNQFTVDPNKTPIENWHLRNLIKESELSGKLIQPNHVFYACINPGMPENLDPTGSATMAGDYGYAIGVFGDGNGLPQNSGVATMEIHMSTPIVGVGEDGSSETRGVTILGSWSNYDGTGIDAGAGGQIRFMDDTADQVSGCAIWLQNTMDGLNGANATSTKIEDVQSAVTTFVSGQHCGEWEFPQYK